MAAGADALDFALRFRQLLLPGDTYRILQRRRRRAARAPASEQSVPGAVLRFDLPGTLELAVRLQPEAGRIVVVNGTCPYDRNWLRRARAALQAYEGRFEVSYWSGLTLQRLLENLRSCPADSIVLYLAFSDDGAGHTSRLPILRNGLPRRQLSLLWSSGDVSWPRNRRRCVSSFEAHGKLAGELALRVLANEKPEKIGVQPSPQAVASIDWRQLQRWKISESKLPPGSATTNPSPSMWEQYHWHVIGTLVLIAVQAGLIVGLLLHRARRRRAESNLRETQEIMDLAASAGELGLWMRDPERGDFWANPHFRSLPWPRTQRCASLRGCCRPHHPEDRARLVVEVERLQESGAAFEGEFRVIGADGSER